MTAESLNFWLTKFIMEVCKDTRETYTYLYLTLPYLTLHKRFIVSVYFVFVVVFFFFVIPVYSAVYYTISLHFFIAVL